MKDMSDMASVCLMTLSEESTTTKCHKCSNVNELGELIQHVSRDIIVLRVKNKMSFLQLSLKSKQRSKRSN